jgi:acyl carrier protein
MTTETIVTNSSETGSGDASPVSLKVKQIIIDKLGVEAASITDNARFAGDLGADSLDVFELMIELEKEFDITIPSEEAEKLYTVGSVVNCIIKHIKT